MGFLVTYTIRIVAPNFVAGVICTGDKVIKAAPILSFAYKCGARQLKDWARSKGFTVEQSA